jgi:hypothetical protein
MDFPLDNYGLENEMLPPPVLFLKILIPKHPSGQPYS